MGEGLYQGTKLEALILLALSVISCAKNSFGDTRQGTSPSWAQRWSLVTVGPLQQEDGKAD